MTPMDLWHSGLTLGTPILAGIMTLLGIYLKKRLDRQDEAQKALIANAAAAAVSAALAAERSAPTGNGYARRTEETLGRIEKDVGGIRADLRSTNNRLDDHTRTTTTRLNDLSRRLNRHLDHQENS